MACEEAYLGECCDSNCPSPEGWPIITAFDIQLGPVWPNIQSDPDPYLAWSGAGGGTIAARYNGGAGNNVLGRGALKPGRWNVDFLPSGSVNTNGFLQYDHLLVWATGHMGAFSGSEIRFAPQQTVVETAAGGFGLPDTPGAAVSRQIIIPCSATLAYFMLIYYQRVSSGGPNSNPGLLRAVGTWLSDPP
jgi:hypothetical protein